MLFHPSKGDCDRPLGKQQVHRGFTYDIIKLSYTNKSITQKTTQCFRANHMKQSQKLNFIITEFVRKHADPSLFILIHAA